MKNRKRYYKDLKKEIIDDPTNQGYAKILKAKHKRSRDKFTKLAQKINLNRAIDLGFPIVRTNIVVFVMGDS